MKHRHYSSERNMIERFPHGARVRSFPKTLWTSQPNIWFAQAKAQFSLRRISADETKYYYVIAALDQQTATRLLDLIRCLPTDNKYATLKGRLIRTFGRSKRERGSRLLHFRPLGDSKPSTLMDEMLGLLHDHPPCLLFKQLFLERLTSASSWWTPKIED